MTEQALKSAACFLFFIGMCAALGFYVQVRVGRWRR